jgi:hypothetical protein
MRKSALFSTFFIFIMTGATETAPAAETIMLRAGEAAGPNAVFAFEREAKPHAIVLRTSRVGVAGSRFEVTIDRAKRPVFDHIFGTEECKFGDSGSRCEVVIQASKSNYASILRAFRRGRLARVTIQDAGVMKMDQTVSLIGFTAASRGL